MSVLPYHLDGVTGTLERIDDQAIFLCNELPLGGIGLNGVEAPRTFFASLVVYFAYIVQITAKEKITAPTGRTSDAHFEFSAPEIDYRIWGKLRSEEGQKFTASYIEQQADPWECVEEDPFDAVVNFLEGVRTQSQNSSIRDYMSNSGKIQFSLTSPDLDRILHHSIMRLEINKGAP